MRTDRLVAVCVLLAAALFAARAHAQAEPEGFPDPGAVLGDPDFKVRTRQFGLDRLVEMYQWRYSDGGYQRVWHGALIDSAGFDAGHANPPKMPLESGRWWADKPTLDGKPLDPTVLRSLGEWRVLRPNFSRLPANLAASFQPEGEGLGSAENPLEPQVGDLRVSWRELVLPPLAGKVALRDGVWQLVDDAEEAGGAEGAAASTRSRPTQRMWPFFASGLVVLAVIVVALLRRRHHRQ